MSAQTSTPPRLDRGPRDDGPSIVRVDEDRTLAYAEYGRPDGAPVVLFHGTPGSRLLGRLFDDAAAEAGVRLLAPDRPGFGQSPPWPDRSMRDAATLVRAVLDDAGVRTAGMIAFSGGCPYALAAAEALDRVDSVDVVSGATPPDDGDATPRTQRMLAGLATSAPPVLGALFRGQAWVAARLSPSLVVDQYTAPGGAESIPDDVAATVNADFVEALAHSRSGAVAEFRESAAEWEVALDDVDATVRFWHGTDDTNVPIAGVRRLQSAVPGARLNEFEDADHLGTLLRSIPDVLAHHRRD